MKIPIYLAQKFSDFVEFTLKQVAGVKRESKLTVENHFR